MQRFEFVVSPQDEGTRIDRFLVEQDCGVSRNGLQHLFAQKLILCDEKPVAKNAKVKKGQTVVLLVPPARPLGAEPQNIPLEIVYEDEHLLVVNKPKGMVVHPAPGNPDGTLVNALLYHCAGRLSSIGGVERPGIVHRIDKNTSGLLVVAKTDAAHESLSNQMSVHSITRVYNAVVYGGFRQPEGFVEAPIGRSAKDRKKMAITEKNAKYAYTGYKELVKYSGFTHVECRLKTGRTHQIRVHLASIGHPVAGDEVYGPKKVITALNGQCLHAKTLGFMHPASGEYMEFTTELPEYYQAFLKTLGKEFEQ